MAAAFGPRTLVLFLGDVLFFTIALWLSLFVRTFSAPPQYFFVAHLPPFFLLFCAWAAVFFIAGLYDRSVVLARRALSSTLLAAQTFNIAIAALFFFFVPLFGIAPKTLLFIYLALSVPLVLFWRAVLFPRLHRPEAALVVGASEEVRELVHALQRAHRAPAEVAAVIDPATPRLAQELRAAAARYGARIIIADWSDPRVSSIFNDLGDYLGQGVRFFDAVELYETVFGRVALRQVDDRWVARRVSRYAHTLYDPLKRLMDMVIALPAALLSLLAYPFVILAIKLEDGGEVFVSLPRVGEGGQLFMMRKFRSMTGNDAGDYGKEGATKLKVTRVGAFLRRSRLDEIPQLWSVVRGDLSLIGPRPETPALVEVYRQEIPYYDMRHLIKPGLSGWAQLYHDNHPHHGTAVEATREKLSFDLYYLTHRSVVLDLTIALKTIKKLLTRSGV